MGKKGKKKSSNLTEGEGMTINGLIENSTTLTLKEASMNSHDTNGVIEINVEHASLNDDSPKEIPTNKLEEETSPSPKLVKESELPNGIGISHELSQLKLGSVPVGDSNTVLQEDHNETKTSEGKCVQRASEQSDNVTARSTASPSLKLPVEIPIIFEDDTSTFAIVPSSSSGAGLRASPGNLDEEDGIRYISYQSELQMAGIMKLIQKDLSEPYSVYTYRYFIHNWPKLCFLAMDDDQMVGVIVCKLDVHKQLSKRGYIAMLAVDERYRRRKIGSNLVMKSIRAMVEEDADEIVLETEITNKSALRLYENLGFVRDKRLFRYYLNGVDALRLKLWLR